MLAKTQGHIARHPEVITEIIFDDVPFIAEAEDELLEPEGGIRLHDVPQNRPVADREHRLGPKLGFFPEPGAFPATQNNDFHAGWLKRWRMRV
jgi:hypothetical protein